MQEKEVHLKYGNTHSRCITGSIKLVDALVAQYVAMGEVIVSEDVLEDGMIRAYDRF